MWQPGVEGVQAEMRVDNDIDREEEPPAAAIAETGEAQEAAGALPIAEAEAQVTTNSRMQLTKEEHGWAMDIKNMILMSPDIDNLTDMMYAQLAIIVQGDVDEAVRRAYTLQDLREEFECHDTYEEAERAFTKAILDYFPGTFMDFETTRDGSIVMVWDNPKFKDYKTHEKTKTVMYVAYYLCHILNPDLEATRKGCVFISENEGYDWRLDMMGAKLMGRIMGDVYGNYPMRFQELKYFHTPVLFNVVMSLGKKAMPKEISSKITVGLQFAGGRLDQFYMTPTPEIASRRTLAKLMASLKQRYENERTFSL